MSIPQFYADATQRYFAYEPNEAEELYAEFLAALPEDLTEVEIQARYMEFLADRLSSIYKSEEKVALSPLEIEARDIFFEIFSIAIDMLRALQDCTRAQSQLLKLYADWQKEYTDMMSQTPIYGPLANYKILADNDDFGNTKLGYADVTVRQMYDYLLKQLEAKNFNASGTRHVKFEHGEHIDGQYDESEPAEGSNVIFHLTENKTMPDGPSTYTATVDLLSYNIGPDEWYSETGGSLITATQDDTTAPSDGRSSYLLNNLMRGLSENWEEKTTGPDRNDIVASMYIPEAGGDEVITYEYLREMWGPHSEGVDPDASTSSSLLWTSYVKSFFWGPWNAPTPGAWPETIGSWEDQGYSDEDKIAAKRGASQGFRGELNAQLQLFIQNVDARKRRVRDMSEGTESIITQIRESIQAQSNLLSAITESLKSLISAIFR